MSDTSVTRFENLSKDVVGIIFDYLQPVKFTPHYLLVVGNNLTKNDKCFYFPQIDTLLIIFHNREIYFVNDVSVPSKTKDWVLNGIRHLYGNRNPNTDHLCSDFTHAYMLEGKDDVIFLHTQYRLHLIRRFKTANDTIYEIRPNETQLLWNPLIASPKWTKGNKKKRFKILYEGHFAYVVKFAKQKGIWKKISIGKIDLRYYIDWMEYQYESEECASCTFEIKNLSNLTLSVQKGVIYFSVWDPNYVNSCIFTVNTKTREMNTVSKIDEFLQFYWTVNDFAYRLVPDRGLYVAKCDQKVSLLLDKDLLSIMIEIDTSKSDFYVVDEQYVLLSNRRNGKILLIKKDSPVTSSFFYLA